MKYKGTLKVLDKKPITPRTGKDEVEVSFDKKPYEGGYIKFVYEEELESPGVMIGTDGVEYLDDMCKFVDTGGRSFELRFEDK